MERLVDGKETWKNYLGIYLNIPLSRSAHQTPNFTNPEFQFPQFKMLQSG